MKKSPRFFRRALTLALAFALSFSVTTRAYALSARFQIGDCSDDVQRVETRLSDLGYLSALVNGRWEQTDADALAARFFFGGGRVGRVGRSSLVR